MDELSQWDFDAANYGWVSGLRHWNPIVAVCIVPRDLLLQTHSPLPTTGRGDYQKASKTQILSVDTLKSTCQGLYWRPVHWLSFLKTCNLKSSALNPAIKFSYLVCTHLCPVSHWWIIHLYPRCWKNELPCKHAWTTSGWRRSSLQGCPEDTAHGRAALNLSSWGGARSGVLNRHLRQVWRLDPVSRSICCTAMRLHLCTRRTCVSWVTFKLIWGLCWSDSRPNGAWQKP